MDLGLSAQGVLVKWAGLVVESRRGVLFPQNPNLCYSTAPYCSTRYCSSPPSLLLYQDDEEAPRCRRPWWKEKKGEEERRRRRRSSAWDFVQRPSRLLRYTLTSPLFVSISIGFVTFNDSSAVLFLETDLLFSVGR